MGLQFSKKVSSTNHIKGEFVCRVKSLLKNCSLGSQKTIKRFRESTLLIKSKRYWIVLASEFLRATPPTTPYVIYGCSCQCYKSIVCMYIASSLKTTFVIRTSTEIRELVHWSVISQSVLQLQPCYERSVSC